MEQYNQIYNDLLRKTNQGKDIPKINKNGVEISRVTIFEDIMLRNLDNMDTVALEIIGEGTKLKYFEFFQETEKYMNCFKNMNLSEGDVVSLCLPPGIEFICAYFAATTLGITVNALNIMFLLTLGVKAFLDERCSQTLIIDENYYKLLMQHDIMNDENLKTIIVTGDATYNHLKNDGTKINIAGKKMPGVEIIAFDDFLKNNNVNPNLKAVAYDENRISTLNYTSGTTGFPKCMGHSDLAPLFLNAAHDNIKRDEYRKDRTLVTIPLQHPTGLFYSMVFQMAQGKTLVLEPRYDKKLFSYDIKSANINHAVQAKPFYAQLIQDRADGILKPGDFVHFRNAYSGGEGIPLAVCREINDTLKYAGCPSELVLGYGRSEEGSSTIIPYNIVGRENTVGVPLSGIRAKIVDAKTLEDLPYKAGVKGEILVSTPVMPIYNSYLAPYNKKGMPDDSIVDENGVVWARAKDIATLVEMPDKSLSYLALGRAADKISKDNQEYYLFDLKEQISDILGVQECEVLSIPNSDEDLLTVHLVLKDEFKNNKEDVIRHIYESINIIDGIKLYDIFGINATSGKCDREAMAQAMDGYYCVINNEIYNAEFKKDQEKRLVRTISQENKG